MKKLLFILLLLPLFVYPQAVKRHRSMIIDSLKALNGGIIDVKDTLKQDIGIKFNDGTFQSTAAVASGADSSFVTLQVDNINVFNNNTIAFDTTTLFLDGLNNRIGIGTVSPAFGLTVDIAVGDAFAIRNTSAQNLAFIGHGADGATFQLKNQTGSTILVLFNTGSDSYINDGNDFGIGTSTPGNKLVVKAANNKGYELRSSGDLLQALLQWDNTAGGQFVLFESDGATPLLAFNSTDSYINDGKEFGVGLTTPTAKLHVKGIDATSGNFAFIAEDNTGADLLSIRNDGPVIVNNTLNYHTDTSSVSDAYGIVEPLLTAYVTGMNLYISIGVANTDAATFQINALAAKAIKKLHDQDVVTGDIEAGHILHLIYDGTKFQILSQLAQ